MKTPHKLPGFIPLFMFILSLPLYNLSSAQTNTVSEPTLLLTLADRWEEAWLGSPTVVDIDGDDQPEIIVPRANAIVAWNNDGSVLWKYNEAENRIFGSAVVADFRDDSKLEIAFTSGDKVYMLDANGSILSGFPVTWESELRGLSAGDIDGNGELELVASLAATLPTDVINAWHADGSRVSGFPPISSGASGCTDNCFSNGVYNQNIAIGNLDGDTKMDIVVPQDIRSVHFYKGSGEMFDANEMFQFITKSLEVCYFHDYNDAKRSYPVDTETALQSTFTNTVPTIADINGDGTNEIILLGSAEMFSGSDPLKGVALWVVNPDGSRISGWESPLHISDYLSGRYWFDGTYITGATNQVSLADINSEKSGPEIVFAGYDGKIHAVAADQSELWTYAYTDRSSILTSGVVIGDLSNDGIPEIIFTTYTTEEGYGSLFILDANGNELHEIALPGRGAMPVPTLADIDANGTVEIVVSLKDAVDQVQSVLVYTVSSSTSNYIPWPTSRANYLRNGYWEHPGNSNSIKTEDQRTARTQMFHNYPNPFTNSTQIKFYLEEAGEVCFEVYNILGKKVNAPEERYFSQGHHDITFDGSDLPEGIYFYKIRAGEFEVVGRIVKVE